MNKNPKLCSFIPRSSFRVHRSCAATRRTPRAGLTSRSVAVILCSCKWLLGMEMKTRAKENADQIFTLSLFFMP
jgi:hypothetical protein